MEFQLNVQTSREAAASLQKVELLQETTTNKLTQLWEQRRQFLLTGTDDELVTIDQHIAAAERTTERALAAAEVLQERHDTLLQTEAKKALEDNAKKQLKKGKTAMDRGLAIYSEFEKTARALLALQIELQGIHEIIDAAQDAAIAADMSYTLELPYIQLSVPSEKIVTPPRIEREELVAETDITAAGDSVISHRGFGNQIKKGETYVVERKILGDVSFTKGVSARDLTKEKLTLPDPFDNRLSIEHA